jgi:hypothetical protein
MESAFRAILFTDMVAGPLAAKGFDEPIGHFEVDWRD